MRRASTCKPSPGLERLHAIQAAEIAEHDKAVAGYPPSLLEAAYDDLSKRKAFDRKDPEQRWIMSRRAALRRAAMKMMN